MSLTIGMVVSKVVALIVVCKIGSICALRIYKAPFSLLLFVYVWNESQGKVDVFSTSQGKSGNFDSRIGCEPCLKELP